MNKIKFLIIIILGFFGLFAISYAAPSFRIERSIIPEQSARFFLGTTTPSTTAWLGVITDELCLTGDVCRTTWPTGGSGTYSFTPTIIGGTEHSASTTRPFYFGQGLLAASSTLGYLNVGYINATSSTASTFAGGVTITCTSCITDANVADLAVGGDVTGTLSAIAVTDDSHAHTGATISGLDISGDTNLTANGFVKTGGGVGTLSVDTSTYLTTVDISANTNLAATFPIVLTGDTLSFGWAYPFIGNATSSVLTLSSAPIFSSLTGVLKGNGASALSVAVDGTDFSLITALTCTGTDKFSAVTADGTFTCTTDSTSAGGGPVNPFDFITIG